MSIREDMWEFLKDTVQGPAYCRIRISEIGKLYFALVKVWKEALSEKGVSVGQIVRTMGPALRGVCPECGTWYLGETISLVGAMQEGVGTEKGKVMMDSRTKRVADGHCLNERCKCPDITICWRIDADERVRGRTYGEAAQLLGLSEIKDPYEPK
ncbi:MAG: hypothetical protein ACFFDP_05530 [Promethearchaeota archaeon]